MIKAGQNFTTTNAKPFDQAFDMKRFYLIIALAALLSVGFYLGWCALGTALGFPIDDAWIHQVFARNLWQRGEFSYNPGQLVAGSTSPLWTFLLAPGYIFGGEGYLWWSYLLGLGLLVLTAGEVARLYQLLFPDISTPSKNRRNWSPYLLAALFTVFEWRLVWAAASGMETLLFAFGTLWLVRTYLETARAENQAGQSESKPSRQKLIQYGLLGLGGGLLTLIRPEGMVLLGLIGLDTGRRGFGKWWPWLGPRWLVVVLGWAVPVAPYLLFNYAASGSPLPATFYAKSNYYADSRNLAGFIDYFGRALDEVFLRGSLLFLLPGLLVGLYLCLKPGKRAGDWRPLVWIILLLLLYAVQLPVTYHHARYLMPLIPFLIIYGVYGSARIVDWLRAQKLRALARFVPFLLALPLLVNWFNQAQAYRFDVKFINDEQVQVGRWLNANTPPDAIVASHDIGAIGYFSGRKLVDTAGLVSPKFIPIVLNETAILQEVKAEKVDYFALFPDWYPTLYQILSDEKRKVYQPDESYLAALNKDNMAVFKLK
jgi:hypothetical protein